MRSPLRMTAWSSAMTTFAGVSGISATGATIPAAKGLAMRSYPQSVGGLARFSRGSVMTSMGHERSNTMNHEIERHKQMINTSGMGLLPGIGLAFMLALFVMLALLAESWWALAGVLATLFAITGVMVWVIVKLIGADGDPGH